MVHSWINYLAKSTALACAGAFLHCSECDADSYTNASAKIPWSTIPLCYLVQEHTQKIPPSLTQPEQLLEKEVHFQYLSAIIPFSVMMPEKNFGWQLYERMSYQTTNRFNTTSMLDALSKSIEQRSLPEDIYAKQARSAFKKAASQTIRQYLLDSMTLDDYIRGELGQQLKNLFIDNEDDTLRSPFKKEEGVPGFERQELGRLPRRIETGMRLLRTNPFAFTTVKIGDSYFHARTDLDETELSLQKPLSPNITAVMGYRTDWRDEKERYAFFGLSGYLIDGSFNVGATFHERSAGVSFSYMSNF